MSDTDSEKSAVLAAALEQLFEQYPTGNETYLRWRYSSVELLTRHPDTRGIAKAWVLGAGIPDDVINALWGLLDE